MKWPVLTTWPCSSGGGCSKIKPHDWWLKRSEMLTVHSDKMQEFTRKWMLPCVYTQFLLRQSVTVSFSHSSKAELARGHGTQTVPQTERTVRSDPSRARERNTATQIALPCSSPKGSWVFLEDGFWCARCPGDFGSSALVWSGVRHAPLWEGMERNRFGFRRMLNKQSAW